MKTLQVLGLGKGVSVLDLGRGYGHFTIAAANLVKPRPVVGIEIDRPILRQAHKTAEPNGKLLMAQCRYA